MFNVKSVVRNTKMPLPFCISYLHYKWLLMLDAIVFMHGTGAVHELKSNFLFVLIGKCPVNCISFFCCRIAVNINRCPFWCPNLTFEYSSSCVIYTFVTTCVFNVIFSLKV